GIAICRAYTSSDWWHEHIVPNAETLLFPRGKTKFIRPNGDIGTAPGHVVALIGMGQICNDALRNSGLGWFVELRRASTRTICDAPAITATIVSDPAIDARIKDVTRAITNLQEEIAGVLDAERDYPIDAPRVQPPEFEELPNDNEEY